MAVILFKKGTGASTKMSEFGFEHSVASGEYFFTKDEAINAGTPQPEVVVVEADVAVDETVVSEVVEADVFADITEDIPAEAAVQESPVVSKRPGRPSTKGISK